MPATAVRYSPDQNNFYNPECPRRNNLFHYYRGTSYLTAVDETTRPDFPYVCSFEFTNRCNLDCVFCARQVMTRQLGNLDDALFRKMMAEFAERGTFLKVNGYGEPMMHPKALDFIRHIKKSNGLYFTTNMTLVDEPAAECFVESGLDVLQISFQGTDKASYEAQRVHGDYDKLFESLRTLVRVRGDAPYPFIHLSTTILDETPEQVERFIEHAFEQGVDAVGVGRTDYDRVIPDMLKKPKRRAQIDQFRERQTLEKVPDHTYLYKYIDINWNGVVVSSFFDFNEFVPVGDLKTQTMFEIWNHSPVLKALRVLERRGLLNNFGEVREALQALDQSGASKNLRVFDTFFHAWKLGQKSYNTEAGAAR